MAYSFFAETLSFRPECGTENSELTLASLFFQRED